MNEGEWTNLKQVTGGLMNAVGLKEDGGVVSAGDITYGQLNVESWMDIQQVATFMFHTVGLKTDGTVVAVDN
jgi:hypothetical protein